MILFSNQIPSLLYEIFKLSMGLRISNFMVNLKEVIDAVNTPTRIHHPFHEVIVVIKILTMLILNDHIV